MQSLWLYIQLMLASSPYVLGKDLQQSVDEVVQICQAFPTP